MNITHIKKRNGTLQEYDIQKIAHAVSKALAATGEGEGDEASTWAGRGGTATSIPTALRR